MSINSDDSFSLRKRYEEAKYNLKYSSDDMLLYYIDQLEEVTDEILKGLAAYLLNDDDYVVKGRSK